MRHHLAQPARAEVPRVARPDSFGVEAFNQLPNNVLNPPSLLYQEERPSLLLPPRRAIGREKMQTLSGQLPAQDRAPVVAISQNPTLCSLQQSFRDRQLMRISRGQMKSDDHARPADSRVCAHSEEGLMSLRYGNVEHSQLEALVAWTSTFQRTKTCPRG